MYISHGSLSVEVYLFGITTRLKSKDPSRGADTTQDSKRGPSIYRREEPKLSTVVSYNVDADRQFVDHAYTVTLNGLIIGSSDY